MFDLTRRRVLVGAIAVIALIAVACGSAADSLDGSGDDATPETGTETDLTGQELEALFEDRLGPLWDTDFTKHSVDLGEFVQGQLKDRIPAITDTPFDSVADASFVDREPVIAVKINGDARAFPLGILTRHEIANTTIGGVPVAVTFCPLCNSAVVFNRELNGTVYEFAVSGFLRNSDLVMFDRQTETWWQQFTGEATVGELTGSLLEVLPSSIVSWADFKATYPDGQVLSTETGFPFDYGFNPYIDYDSDEDPFLFRGEFDDRLSPIERVVAVEIGDDAVAYPFGLLEQVRVVEDTVGGERIVVFHQPGTVSALDEASIADSRDIGAAGVFTPAAAGQELTFRAEGDDIFDNETNSRWNVLGKAVEGPLAGEELAPVVHGDHFWFAWSAFNPDTRVFEG